MPRLRFVRIALSVRGDTAVHLHDPDRGPCSVHPLCVFVGHIALCVLVFVCRNGAWIVCRKGVCFCVAGGVGFVSQCVYVCVGSVVSVCVPYLCVVCEMWYVSCVLCLVSGVWSCSFRAPNSPRYFFRSKTPYLTKAVNPDEEEEDKKLHQVPITHRKRRLRRVVSLTLLAVMCGAQVWCVGTAADCRLRGGEGTDRALWMRAGVVAPWHECGPSVCAVLWQRDPAALRVRASCLCGLARCAGCVHLPSSAAAGQPKRPRVRCSSARACRRHCRWSLSRARIAWFRRCPARQARLAPRSLLPSSRVVLRGVWFACVFIFPGLPLEVVLLSYLLAPYVSKL